MIGLQTAFGGGKTHTMLAIFHLAKHLGDGGDPRALPGLGRFWRRPRPALPKPKMAVFVGSADGPDVSLKLTRVPASTRYGAISPGALRATKDCNRR